MKRIFLLIFIVSLTLNSLFADEIEDFVESIAYISDVIGNTIEFIDDIDELEDENGQFSLDNKGIKIFLDKYPVLAELVDQNPEISDKARPYGENPNMEMDVFILLENDLEDRGIESVPRLYLITSEVISGFKYFKEIESEKEDLKGLEIPESLNLEELSLIEKNMEKISEAFKLP